MVAILGGSKVSSKITIIENILDKVDHHGSSTIMLLDRKKLSSLEHHHENKLIVHAEFPSATEIDTANSYVNFFK